MPAKEIKEVVGGATLLEEGGQEPLFFGRLGVPPGADLLVLTDDFLYIRSVGSAAGVTLSMRGRFRAANGEIVPFDIPHTPNSNRTAALTKVQLGIGFLLSVCVDVLSGTVRKGQVYVEVGLDRGGPGTTFPAGTLFTGYPAQQTRLGYPPGAYNASVDGAGALRSVNGAAPAAGTDWIVTVPAGARWQLVGLRAQLVTAVAVANRIPHIIIDDGATALLEWAGLEAQAASLTNTWVAAGDGTSVAVQDTVHHFGIATPLLLFQGWRIRSSTTALQAADQWSAQQLLVQEWLEV